MKYSQKYNDLVRAVLAIYAGVALVPQAITPVNYQGTIAGSEFLVYNAAKCYIAESISFIAASTTTGSCRVELFDHLNNLNFIYQNITTSYDAGVPVNRFTPFSIPFPNVYFSRINNVGLSYMYFIGYRLNFV